MYIHDIVTRNGLENKHDNWAYINSFPCWSCLRCFQLYILLVMIYYNENGFLRIYQLYYFGSINFAIVINNMFIFFNSIYLLKAWWHLRRKGRSWPVWVTITHQNALLVLYICFIYFLYMLLIKKPHFPYSYQNSV